ncbi:MAG: NeuD/PglB/VioB family sugar acetyltransferase [Magnetococcales bacterium]|nr:NeuD/PglB/VioB family sugar acetyltransferase [Magnetococcales bacterium]
MTTSLVDVNTGDSVLHRVLLGAGGHARVLMDALIQTATVVSAVYIPTHELLPPWCEKMEPVHSDDQLLLRFPPPTTGLILGIGSVGDNGKRIRLFEHYNTLGYSFCPVPHPHRLQASGVRMGEGCQIMAGTILQPGVVLGNNVIINTGARIDHDTLIDDHVHIAPGVILSGGVHVERGAHIGTGAVVIQGIRIGAGALVAAGATVVANVASGDRVAGVPARRMTRGQ